MVSSVQPQAVRDVWDGSTVLHPNTDAVCRVATDVAFTVLDVLGYLDEIPVCTGYEIDGEVINRIPDNRACLRKQNRLLRSFRDGNAISVESRNMRIFRRTAENM